jgi:hypothetical protein
MRHAGISVENGEGGVERQREKKNTAFCPKELLNSMIFFSMGSMLVVSNVRYPSVYGKYFMPEGAAEDAGAGEETADEGFRSSEQVK